MWEERRHFAVTEQSPFPAGSLVRPIPIVSMHDFGGEAARFYGQHASHPVIVRDCFPPEHPVMALTLESIEELMGDIPIHVYGAAAETYREVPASAIFAGVRGHGEPYNVVDFYLRDTALGRLFDVPPFLRHNWFLQPPASVDHYEKSLVLSPAGAYTPLHLDSYAMQGWMFLIAGRKTWICYGPDSIDAAFLYPEKRFRNTRQDPLGPLAACERWQGEIGRGDLLYFPAGWVHEVATHEISYGLGGSVLNDYQIEAHMRWWLWERDLNFEGSMDLKRVVAEMPPHRFSEPDGRRRAEAALQLCQTWESRHENRHSALLL